MGVSQFRAAIAEASLQGIDLDLTTPLRRWRLARQAVSQDAVSDIRSIWLPSSGYQGDQREAWFVTIWEAAAQDGKPVTLIVPAQGGLTSPMMSRQVQRAITLQREAPTAARVALAVHPRNPDGGRAHLVHLSALRAFAEEWELELALDLTGHVDWLWEAEAAIYRMMPRLSLIRLTFPLPRLDAHVRTRMTKRVLAAAIDGGFAGAIALSVPLPLWRWRNERALASIAASAAGQLAERFGISAQYTSRDLPQRFFLPRQ
jgi:hypothetical protein